MASPTIRQFEDVIAWKKSRLLVINVYKTFQTCKDHSFRDQIQRAAVSVMNNVAEGFERKGKRELSHFLYISKGSCGEVRSMIDIAFELNYISEEDKFSLSADAVEVSKILSGFIKSID